MKLRPQFNLKLRDAEQFYLINGEAAREDISMNEYILRGIEGFYVVLKGQRIAAEMVEGNNGQGSAVPEIKEAGQENRATRKQSRNVGGEKVGVARPQEAEAVNPIETDAVGTTGCKVTVSRPMAGRPAHAGNCQCLTCKPPKENK